MPDGRQCCLSLLLLRAEQEQERGHEEWRENPEGGKAGCGCAGASHPELWGDNVTAGESCFTVETSLPAWLWFHIVPAVEHCLFAWVISRLLHFPQSRMHAKRNFRAAVVASAVPSLGGTLCFCEHWLWLSRKPNDAVSDAAWMCCEWWWAFLGTLKVQTFRQAWRKWWQEMSGKSPKKQAKSFLFSTTERLCFA